MQNYFNLLKKCKTLHWACQVFIAVMLDEKLTNKEKDELFIKIKQGDEEARETFLQQLNKLLLLFHLSKTT